MSTEQIDFKNIVAFVTYKPIKNINLRIDSEGNVKISAPFFVSKRKLKKIIEEKYDWIVLSKQKVLERSSQKKKIENLSNNVEFVTGDVAFLWGDKYAIDLKTAKRWSCEVDSLNKKLILTQTSNADKDKRKAYLRKWYSSQLLEEAYDLLLVWEEKTGLKADELRAKFMKTRWGTCNKKDKRIWLNTQLVFYDKKYLESVLVHEIAHLKISNHGDEFKKFMDFYLPGWRQTRSELKKL